MASKKERMQAKAQKMLDKYMPYEQWVQVRERTEEEKELYKQTRETLQNIVDGKNEIFDTVTTTIKNGKTSSKLS
ncbi:hypothetical protein [Salinimicrobium sediminilitoris]|uniref:hypothetical protein n=1 Tax=Salinimicrobium sediminilitoris TaxID=2876715 RepID=UPI001E642E51|nr:hypothetical protein [Salinimicrobium sediminilitoris]MCC8360588.1 hypothetical protein [Salinimicrobium sediminilitoris]